MSKKESLVEDTFIQLKNLENMISENAQGILESTMTKEIKELVKESLNEQDDEEIDVDAEVDEPEADNDEMEMDDMDMDDEMNMDDMDMDDEEEIDMDDMEMDVEDDTIDLTNASDEEILRVFKAMNDDDGIIVKKEDNMLHLSDDNEDVEYLIQLGESEFGTDINMDSEMDEMYDMEEMDEMEDMDDEVIYELHIDSDMEDRKPSMRGHFFDREDEESEWDDEDIEDEDEMDSMEDEDEMDSMEDEDEMDSMEDYFDMEEEYVMEASKFNAKGMGMGNASKFKYNKKPNQDGGFDVKKKQGTRGVGMGKAKFEYKEEVNTGRESKKSIMTKKPMVKNSMDKKPMVKKMETKEASRTYASGSKEGRGLRKGITPNRNLTFESRNEELNLLREKNEEYRKALNLFRTKLNEVAVFNSNLAYATRLFTEHSTTKQEKINILKRFDGVETIKESKNLYKTIKDDLSTSTNVDNTITESFERTLIKTPASGSAVNLIESKTYENPQFLRMKDLMGKIK